MAINFETLEFCAKMCENLGHKPSRVYDMAKGFDALLRSDHKELANLPEYKQSVMTAEKLVFVANIFKVEFEDDYFSIIARELKNLYRQVNNDEITVLEFYQNFLEIHPLEACNDLVGIILFNLLNDTLANPTMPEQKQ